MSRIQSRGSDEACCAILIRSLPNYTIGGESLLTDSPDSRSVDTRYSYFELCPRLQKHRSDQTEAAEPIPAICDTPCSLLEQLTGKPNAPEHMERPSRKFHF